MSESDTGDEAWREWPDSDEHVVFVLGAGFSRAISKRMPLTDELGLAALAKLRGILPARLGLGRFPRGMNFESWLSQLASDQPYLSDADNAENHAAFVRFSEAIASVLGQRVDDVLSENYPEWLLEFVSAAHHTLATMITFNYDTLIECFVETPIGILGKPGETGSVWQGVGWTELSELPPWPPGNMRLGYSEVETLRLLKLHGSLNWYWRPGDENGISVARRILPGTFEAPSPYTDDDRRRQVPGRVPFVVPPSASKSTYYSNPITKEMWTQAAERLRRAKRVVIMGYSLPATDTTFSDMLRESIGGNDCDVVIADNDPVPVRDRLRTLGIAEDRMRIGPSGSEAVASMVDSWVDALSRGSLRQLLGHTETDRRLILAWGDGTAYAPVAKLEKTADGVLAHTERIYSSFAQATGIGSRPSISLAEAAQQIEGADESSLGLQAAHPRLETIQHVITVLEHSITPVGGESDHWLVLQVAATPPSADPIGSNPTQLR